MTRTAQNQGILRGHGAALALAGAAAAAIASVAGTASAATTEHSTAAQAQGVFSHEGGSALLSGAGASGTLTGAAAPGLFGHASTEPAHPAAPHAVPVRRPAQLAVRTTHTATAKPAAKPAPKPAGKPAAKPASKPAAKPVAHDATAKHAVPDRPFEIYDSVTPSQIPAHHEIATYADGGYAVAPSAVTGKHVLWIDTNGSDPKANALDVEPGDATPAGAAAWARAKLTQNPNSPAIIYTMRSDWAATQASVDTLPTHMRAEVRWWIADPTGYPHIVPGASATQWYWGKNFDISSARPGF